MEKQKEIRVFGLNEHQISLLRAVALQRYGKASVSLLARKLLQETIHQSECSLKLNPQQVIGKQRLTLRLPPAHQSYLSEKSRLQHTSMNEIVRDIIAEYITEQPVISNDAVQALYQSNYQLLRIGRNINQLARQLNSIQPNSFTTQQLNELEYFLKQHTQKVGKVLRKQDKPFKYRPINELQNETNKSAD